MFDFVTAIIAAALISIIIFDVFDFVAGLKTESIVLRMVAVFMIAYGAAYFFFAIFTS